MPFKLFVTVTIKGPCVSFHPFTNLPQIVILKTRLGVRLSKREVFAMGCGPSRCRTSQHTIYHRHLVKVQPPSGHWRLTDNKEALL